MADGSASNQVVRDLALSGLTVEDMSVRPLENPERATIGIPFTVQGYVIPYFDIDGKPVPFYRARLFDHDIKYKQGKDTSSHIYFPKGFKTVAGESSYVILTEGEKKATIATKLGFPCCAVGGVDSWRNRILQLPGDSALSQNKGKLQAKVPVGELLEESVGPLAVGLQDLIDYLIIHQKTLIIIYDSDTVGGVKPQVQRAAATLAFELRFRGIKFSHLRQVVLPVEGVQANPESTILTTDPKVGLDDYFASHPKEDFQGLIDKCLEARSAFPRHPNVREFINKRLAKSNLPRKEYQAISMAILSELDSEGLRLHASTEKQMYYFNMRTKKLIPARLSTSAAESMSTTPFEQHLYREYGVGQSDRALNNWIASQFTGEDPIDDVVPYRVFAKDSKAPDKIVYQVSDSHYVAVSGNENADSPDYPGLEIYDNGENGIMFESGQVHPLDMKKVLKYYKELAAKPQEFWWYEVFQEVRLRDRGMGRQLISLLYYISPWLYRWRGTQLPVEMILGEAGSGKSTLCELRLDIISGFAKLRNAPQDMKDWTASVVNTGGIHVTDNLQLGDKNLRQKMSDELCRLVTESNPSIEMRKYYTNADLMEMPVRCTFAVTAIQQPFTAADILQRGILIEFDKAAELMSGDISYDSNWKYQQMNKFGGREAWVAHHLLTLHRFLKLASTEWDRRYQAKHRLINLEQCMVLMAKTVGINPDWIPSFLAGMTDRAISEADWAFEGIQAFCDRVKAENRTEMPILASQIVEWAMDQEDFRQCEVLINARRLGRYITTHKTTIAQACGLVEAGKMNNRVRYKVLKDRFK